VSRLEAKEDGKRKKVVQKTTDKVVLLHSKLKPEERAEIVRRWQEEKKFKDGKLNPERIDVLITTGKVGGVGLTFTESCFRMVFMESWASHSAFWQAVGRLARIGQKNPIIEAYVWMNLAFDVDRRSREICLMRMKMAIAAMGG